MTMRNGTDLEIAWKGRLDTTTAPELEAELNRSMSDATPNSTFGRCDSTERPAQEYCGG